jgi:hypothetical protein
MLRFGTIRGLVLGLGFCAASSMIGGGASTAAAQDPGFLWYFGGWRPYGITSSTLAPTPPYFSLFPPVYYGERYARPYGVSPFAALPQDVTMPAYQARMLGPSRSYSNPHCCGEAEATAQPVQLQGQPSEIAQVSAVRINPFVQTPDLLADRD